MAEGASSYQVPGSERDGAWARRRAECPCRCAKLDVALPFGNDEGNDGFFVAENTPPSEPSLGNVPHAPCPVAELRVRVSSASEDVAREAFLFLVVRGVGDRVVDPLVGSAPCAVRDGFNSAAAFNAVVPVLALLGPWETAQD